MRSWRRPSGSSTAPSQRWTAEGVRALAWCHAVWERLGDGLVGWVGSRPTPLRRAHIERTPYVSCFYWDPAHDVAVAECEVTWTGDGFVALRLDPWRVQAKSAAEMAAGEPYLVWAR
jgi:hypothetical protein